MNVCKDNSGRFYIILEEGIGFDDCEVLSRKFCQILNAKVKKVITDSFSSKYIDIVLEENREVADRKIKLFFHFDDLIGDFELSASKCCFNDYIEKLSKDKEFKKKIEDYVEDPNFVHDESRNSWCSIL